MKVSMIKIIGIAIIVESIMSRISISINIRILQMYSSCPEEGSNIFNQRVLRLNLASEPCEPLSAYAKPSRRLNRNCSLVFPIFFKVLIKSQ